MPNQHQIGHKILSLTQWPSKPLNQHHIRLSPVSSRILKKSGHYLNDLLPISISDYLGIKLLNEENIDQLIQQYTKFNSNRIKQIHQLRKQRYQYENYQDIQRKNTNFYCKPYNQVRMHSQPFISSKYSPKSSMQTKKPNEFHSFKDSFQNFDTNGQQNVQTMRAVYHDRNQVNKLKPNSFKRIIEPISWIQNNKTYEKKQNPKKKKLTNSKSMKNTAFYVQNKVKASQGQKIRKKKSFLFHKNQSPVLKSSSPIKSRTSKPFFSSQKNNYLPTFKKKNNQKKSPLKQTRLDYYGSFPKLTPKASIQSMAKSRKINQQTQTQRKNRHTQLNNFVAMDQYYDSSSTNIVYKQKPNINVFISPTLDELTQAVEQLIHLTERQQTQIQMIDNLNRHEDKLGEHQKKRLLKIHRIQREQLKGNICDLKNQLKDMRIGKMVNLMQSM